MRSYAAVCLVLPASLGFLFAEAPPAWVSSGGTATNSYPSSRYLTGYGLSNAAGSEAEQRRQAVALAHEALAGAIRTHITSEFTSKVTQQNQQMSRFVQNLVRTKAEVELPGLDTILVWTDPRGKGTHALVVLDKPRTLHILADQAERQARDCTTAFDRAKTTGEVAGLLKARHLREELEEAFLVRAVLGGPASEPPCPPLADIDHELRQRLEHRVDLQAFVTRAALDLGTGLPRGIRILVDRVTYGQTPFCGSLSAYLEQALAGELVRCGQVKIVDKAAGRNALSEGGLDRDLAEALSSQAVVRGTCFELGEEVQLDLRVTSAGGEALSAATLRLPAALVRRAGLKLAPDNFEAAKKALEICEAQVQDSKLKVKLALDRGDGGIYRKGEKLHLFLKANMACYVKVVYHQVDGENVVIFPNKFHPADRIEQDRVYQIPPDDQSFVLEVMEPFGVEMVKVVASTDPIDLPASLPDANGFHAVREDLASLMGRTRGIRLKKAEVQYGEDTAVVNTMDQAHPLPLQ